MRKVKMPKPQNIPLQHKRIAAQIQKLSTEQLLHFMELSEMLLMCYADPPQASAVLLVEPSEGGTLIIASANACDMTVAELVAEAQQVMKGVVVSDAPPKELFN
jgi:hypothetical protein